MKFPAILSAPRAPFRALPTGLNEMIFGISYSIKVVSKALRLNYSDLKEHVNARSAAANVKTFPAPGFIDLGCSQNHFEPECVFKMQDAAGLKIKISVRGKAD